MYLPQTDEDVCFFTDELTTTASDVCQLALKVSNVFPQEAHLFVVSRASLFLFFCLCKLLLVLLEDHGHRVTVALCRIYLTNPLVQNVDCFFEYSSNTTYGGLMAAKSFCLFPYFI